MVYSVQLHCADEIITLTHYFTQQWSPACATLATLSEDGVTLLAEHPSCCHVSSTMVAIQSRPRKIDINFIAEKTTQESAFSGMN